MDHTHIIQASDLDLYATRRDSQGVIPELIYLLVKQSVSELSICRIPYGDAVNQPGLDGLVETEESFLEFVPKGKSYWEIGTGNDPQGKATSDFQKRTKETPDGEKKLSTFIFVTPRSSGSNGWDEPRQTKWISKRKECGWKEIRIIDGVKLADWLREYPALGRWMLKKIGVSRNLSSISTPAEHWDIIQSQIDESDPPLPSQLFITGRENACIALRRIFNNESKQMLVFVESPDDVKDFVAGYLASLEIEIRKLFSNRCLFISEEDSWRSVVETRKSHVLIADPNLCLESDNANLLTLAIRKNHSVVIPLCGAWATGNPEIIKLQSPSRFQLERILTEGGYSSMRSRELASAGADRLSALKRHLLGLGSLPSYASWENARLIAQSGLIGKWDGNNKADRDAMEIFLGKKYGEWIEEVQPETLRSDTPLIQRNEKWRMVARGEAWAALGPRLLDDDLSRFQKIALRVLGERDPKFDLIGTERFAAKIHGKHLEHSQLLREGIAETLALLGSRPKALSFCSQDKAIEVAVLTVRGLLKNAEWERWAGLDPLLPLLAEAAPDEFLDVVELALLEPEKSVFLKVFAQEGTGSFGGWNYMSGLLWALETLAWNSDYLTRVIIILGDLASIDPGGNYANRPSNSMADILLPWHFQTCASVEKRSNAVKILLQEQPEIAWKLLMALLPKSHVTTSGCHRPTWQKFIPSNWNENVTVQEYWDQTTIYVDMAIDIAKSCTDKLSTLIDRSSELPSPALEILLSHLTSQEIINLPEAQRLPLWEALSDTVKKHRTFSDAEWAMSEDIVKKIDVVADLMTPKSPELRYRYLFSGRGFDFYDANGSYEEQLKRYDLKCGEAVEEILNNSGLPAVLKFAHNVPSPDKVGNSLGNIAKEDVDFLLLPDSLQGEDEVLKRLAEGFVSSRQKKLGWTWVEKMLSQKWSLVQKSVFLLVLPFCQKVWGFVEKNLGEKECYYWKYVAVNPWLEQPNLSMVMKKLMYYDRPCAALECLRRPTENGSLSEPDLATKALLAIIDSNDSGKTLNCNVVIDIISKLQKHPSTDEGALFKIEWYFLPLLNQFSQGSPKTLEKRLSQDPSFYCQLISFAFRSKKEEKKDIEPSEHEQKMAKYAYQLLSECKTLPGNQPDGTFSPDLFSSWLEEVKEITKESGHFEVALAQLGGILIHAPKDPGGLWIHTAVAQALNARDAMSMRSGYTVGLYNQRGVFGYTEGKEELDLARINHEKAAELEAEGFNRFSTDMRKFAKTYEREAEYEKNRDPFER